jgi:hypothetical protein
LLGSHILAQIQNDFLLPAKQQLWSTFGLNGVPVPKVYGYSVTAENPIESEYMILEFIGGINLGDVWFDLPKRAGLKVVENLVGFETRLFDLQFSDKW